LDGLDNFLYQFSQALLLWFRKKFNGCKHGKGLNKIGSHLELSIGIGPVIY